MSTIEMLNGFVAVEKATSDIDKQESTSLFKIPGLKENYGRVKFVKDSTLNEGDIVYYGNDFNQIRMHGIDVLVMKPSNIIAVIRE